MFDINAKDGRVRKHSYKSPIPTSESTAAINANKSGQSAALDSAEMVTLHKRLMGLYLRELDRAAANRREMAEDEDFYDNIQWREDEAQIVRERGQVPLVYNVVSACVDWVSGMEKRARKDFKILPRRAEDNQPAQRKSALMKYLSDVNRTGFAISRAFEDAVKCGIGWLEDGVDYNREGEPIYTKYESWRNILWDSSATELDLADARFIFRSKWLDLDVARAMFPERHGLFDRALDNHNGFHPSDDYGDDAMDAHEEALENTSHANSRLDDFDAGGRDRVRVIEAWIRLPVETEHLQGGQHDGEIYNEALPAHRFAVESGEATLTTRTTMRMHVAIFTAAGMVWFSPSPYYHNRFPLTPVWAYRRGRDGQPYGMIRRLKDIQQDINKRASKALHILSTNKVVMEEGAVEDINELIEEVSRPDAVIVKRPGKEFTLNAERDLAPAHLELMSRSIAMIQQTSGVTDELMGRDTNATSGIAIRTRQDQGTLVTARMFDNLMFFAQARGEKQLALIEQFMHQKRQFRILDGRGRPQYIDINDGQAENDITASRADFIIVEADWQASMRQASANQLLEMAGRLPPEIAITLLDLVAETMDLPNRDEIVKRIRAVNGQRDPDQDETELTMAEMQQMHTTEMQMQLQQVQMQTQMQLLEAEARKKVAEAERAEAQAKQYQARMVRDNIEAQAQALENVETAMQKPDTVPAAMQLLNESGFVTRSEQDMQDAQQQMAAQQAQQQMLAQQMGAQVANGLDVADPTNAAMVGAQGAQAGMMSPEQQIAQQMMMQAAQQQMPQSGGALNPAEMAALHAAGGNAAMNAAAMGAADAPQGAPNTANPDRLLNPDNDAAQLS